MIITIFFMLASLFILIFVPIYVKKKDNLYSLKAQDALNIKIKRRDIKNIWGIDKIQDNVLTVNGSHSIIIELGSIEYRLLNENEQNNIDNNLIKLAKTFKNQTQFFSTIEKIDTSDKIETIRKNLEKQKNPNIKEYGESIIKYLENIMQEENLYVRKNYFIVTSNETYDKAEKELKDFFSEFRYNLSSIKVTTRLLSDMDIIELIHRELNKNSDDKLKNVIMEGGLDFYVQKEREKNIFRESSEVIKEEKRN